MRVQQEEAHGCGIAVLAMLTGQTYQQVRAGFGQHDFTKRGITWFEIQAYLAEHGYAVAPKFVHYLPTKTTRETWPPEPFGKIHFCEVVTGRGTHFVVMLGDGSVVDPAIPGERRLSDYRGVDSVVAVVRV